MELFEFELGPIGTNAFILHEESRQESLIIDAPPGAADLFQRWLEEKGSRPVALLLTHGHWDHMLDMNGVRSLGARVYAHPGDRGLLEAPEVMKDFALPGLHFEPGMVDDWLNDRGTLELLGTQIEYRPVPGHAPGSIMFILAEHGIAFPGDAIFAGGVGRFDLPGGDWSRLERSILEEIYTLPESTRLYPGHGPATTVGREKMSNPFVRAS